MNPAIGLFSGSMFEYYFLNYEAHLVGQYYFFNYVYKYANSPMVVNDKFFP